MGGSLLVVVGIGGFGREVIDAVQSPHRHSRESVRLLGALDDSPTEENLGRLDQLGVPYLGSTRGWDSPSGTGFLIAIAAPGPRARIDRELSGRGARAAVFVDGASRVGTDTRLGPGTIVMAGAQVTVNTNLGRHVHVHVNATVGHDTTLEDFVSLYPNASVGDSCSLADNVTVGANGTVLQGLQIGRGATVGAGAVVTRAVTAGRVVKGVPAQ